MTQASNTAGPVRPEERLLALDVLRGMALLGVLVANVWSGFSGNSFRMAELGPRLARLSLDSVAHHAVSVFVSGKAIAVFSFLFGLGFAVQAMRAEARGAGIGPIYRRRLAVLTAFGLTHGILLWWGDILTAYSLLGFALLLFHRRGDRVLLAWAGVLLVAVPLAFAVHRVLAAGGPAAPGPEHSGMIETLRSLDPARIVPANARTLADIYLGPGGVRIFAHLLGLFLLGLWAGRRRVFERIAEHRAAFRRVALWGAAAGIVASVALEVVRLVPGLRAAAVEAPWWPLAFTTLRIVGVVPLAAAYAAGVALLLERAGWRRRLAAFAPVGRMALTNYLSQTVICISIFYAGGLIGRVGPAAAVGIALLVYAAQMAWSPWWLARFRFGPVEWLWRSLTYGRAQPMRIRAPEAQPGLAV